MITLGADLSCVRAFLTRLRNQIFKRLESGHYLWVIDNGKASLYINGVKQNL